MSNNLCYLGWDMDLKKIVRPILRTNPYCWTVWDPALNVGEKHLFEVVSRNLHETPYPHKTEDLLVVHLNKQSDALISNQDLFNILVGHSWPSLTEAFGAIEIHANKIYVNEGTNCPSVAILKCNRMQLYFYNKGSSYKTARCKLQQGQAHDAEQDAEEFYPCEFDLSVTAVNYDDQIGQNDCLVILGMARPWIGHTLEFDPRRCYLLITGIIANSYMHD